MDGSGRRAEAEPGVWSCVSEGTDAGFGEDSVSPFGTRPRLIVDVRRPQG